MSLDGKVTGDFLLDPECQAAVDTYYAINRELKCGGFICGRVTMEESFTGGWYPDLDKYDPIMPDTVPMDCLPDSEYMTGFYAIAFDPKGRLGWRSAFIEDSDPGYDKAQIIEVLTEQADGRYLAYLKELGIPYIIAGKTEIDAELALIKLYAHIGVDHLLLEGGSVINGCFQRADLIDELSLTVAPITGNADSKPLFDGAAMQGYRLNGCRTYANGTVWLNYRRCK